jgi:hypothetical protein
MGVALWIAPALWGGRAAPRDSRRVAAHAGEPRLEDALDGEPDLLVVLRPRRIARDRLYGPLFRRASLLASTKSGAGNVGTTALAAFERADEAIVAVYDRGGRDAIVAVRGVPAEIDAASVVDTAGKPLWQKVRDEGSGVTEYAPSDPKVDAALFVLPLRVWVIAVGDAIARAGAAYTRQAPSRGALVAFDAGPLAIVQLRGDALVRHEVRLRVGPLAPIGRDLERVSLVLEAAAITADARGSGEITGRFVYEKDAAAAESEARINDVLGAFSRKFGERYRWLDAIRVVRASREIAVRGKLPPSWVEGLLEAEGAEL